MVYILLGILGFICIILFDLASIKRVSFGAKPFLWLTGCLLLLYSGIMLCLEPGRFLVTAWLVWLGWILLFVSSVLLFAVLFVSLPIKQTYVKTGVSNRLVKTGFYALVRHPGIYGLVGLMFSMVLISGSIMMLVGAVIFTTINIILVVIEDKYFFGKMFDDYDSYRKETPMLVPNGRSIAAFWSSVRETRER